MLPRPISLVLLLAAPVAAAEPGFAEINAACGLPLFADDKLWDDSVASVALRLGWPRESETSLDSSYRLYPDVSARFLGARPYSQVLYGEEGRAASLSLVFATLGLAGPCLPALRAARRIRHPAPHAIRRGRQRR